MKLGAQLYSLRENCDTPEKLKETLNRVKKMGYDIVQASAICDIDPALLKSYIEEFDIPIGCTHRPFNEIVNETEKCISFHKTIGCSVIGLGSMPVEYRGSYEELLKFRDLISPAIKKIKEAGLTFAYHNHAFDFDAIGNTSIMEFLINDMNDVDFILDVYWVKYAGKSIEEYMRRLTELGKLNHIHFKDMKEEPQGSICACGDGVIDFDYLSKLCRELGIENVYVEQDNAPSFPDAFEEIKKSYIHLNKIVKEN